MKKPDQDDRPQGGHPGAEKNHQQTDQSRERKQRKQPGSRRALHDVGTGKPSEHESNQVQFQIERSILLEHSRNTMLRQSNGEAAHSDLSANVEELCDNSFYQVAITPDIAQFLPG